MYGNACAYANVMWVYQRKLSWHKCDMMPSCYPLMFDIELVTFTKVNLTRTETTPQMLLKHAKNSGTIAKKLDSSTKHLHGLSVCHAYLAHGNEKHREATRTTKHIDRWAIEPWSLHWSLSNWAVIAALIAEQLSRDHCQNSWKNTWKNASTAALVNLTAPSGYTSDMEHKLHIPCTQDITFTYACKVQLYLLLYNYGS